MMKKEGKKNTGEKKIQIIVGVGKKDFDDTKLQDGLNKLEDDLKELDSKLEDIVPFLKNSNGRTIRKALFGKSLIGKGQNPGFITRPDTGGVRGLPVVQGRARVLRLFNATKPPKGVSHPKSAKKGSGAKARCLN